MTLPDQRANDRVAFGPGRDLIRSKDLRARLGLLVLPSEVHPEQDAAELGVTGAFLDLVLTDPLGVPGALARSERQERALGQACPLDRAAGTRAVARARRAADDVPEVVEAPVRVLRVDLADLREPHPTLVDQEERVQPWIGNRPGRERLEDREPHHPDLRGVYHQLGVALLRVDLRRHRDSPFLASNALVPDLFRTETGRVAARVVGSPQARDDEVVRKVAIVAGSILGAFFVVRAVVELVIIDYSDPSSYANDWGGPSLAGVLLVHCGLGVLTAILFVFAWRRMRADRRNDM